MKDGFKKNKNKDGIMSDGTMVQCCDKYMHGRKNCQMIVLLTRPNFFEFLF